MDKKTLKQVIAGTGIALYGTVAFLLMLSEPEKLSGIWTNVLGCVMVLVAALVLQDREKKA